MVTALHLLKRFVRRLGEHWYGVVMGKEKRVAAFKWCVIGFLAYTILWGGVTVVIAIGSSGLNGDANDVNGASSISSELPNPVYDWTQATLDLPIELVFGSMTYNEWRDKDGARVLDLISVSEEFLATPTSKTHMVRRDRIGSQEVEIFRTHLNYRSELISDPHEELGYYTVVPLDAPSKGTVIAIHGHEEPYRGALPEGMLESAHWSQKFVSGGYTVIIPSHLFYEQAKSMNSIVPYHFLWARFVSDVLDSEMIRSNLTSPVFSAGVSSGCTTASLLTVLTTKVEAFSGAGCTTPLNWFRENYRFEGHPNQWDYPKFISELPIFALAADKRFQFQLGTNDDFFPGGFLTDSKGEPVSSRGVFVYDIAGVFLTLQKIFSKADENGEVELLITPLGHTIDPQAAMDFFENPP